MNGLQVLSAFLKAVGVITSAALGFRLYKFIHLYFLHQTTIHLYRRPNAKAWALVTGASDGVGKETARALQHHGFNVILHARNRSKLDRVSAELNREFPKLQVRLAVADATEPLAAVSAVEAVVRSVQAEGGILTLLVNNLGGGGIFGVPTYIHYADFEDSMINKQIGLNQMFAMHLVHTLLPTLKANQPSLVMNISSYAAFGTPFLAPYSSSKAALNVFSKSLSSEMKALNLDVEVMAVILGSVITPGNHMEKSNFFAPSPEAIAHNILERIGCGQSVVTASWRHCVLGESAGWFPQSFVEPQLIQEILKRRAREQELLKKAH